MKSSPAFSGELTVGEQCHVFGLDHRMFVAKCTMDKVNIHKSIIFTGIPRLCFLEINNIAKTYCQRINMKFRPKLDPFILHVQIMWPISWTNSFLQPILHPCGEKAEHSRCIASCAVIEWV